jgi:hypothetical protein
MYQHLYLMRTAAHQLTWQNSHHFYTLERFSEYQEVSKVLQQNQCDENYHALNLAILFSTLQISSSMFMNPQLTQNQKFSELSLQTIS